MTIEFHTYRSTEQPAPMESSQTRQPNSPRQNLPLFTMPLSVLNDSAITSSANVENDFCNCNNNNDSIRYHIDYKHLVSMTRSNTTSRKRKALDTLKDTASSTTLYFRPTDECENDTTEMPVESNVPRSHLTSTTNLGYTNIIPRLHNKTNRIVVSRISKNIVFVLYYIYLFQQTLIATGQQPTITIQNVSIHPIQKKILISSYFDQSEAILLQNLDQPLIRLRKPKINTITLIQTIHLHHSNNNDINTTTNKHFLPQNTNEIKSGAKIPTDLKLDNFVNRSRNLEEKTTMPLLPSNGVSEELFKTVYKSETVFQNEGAQLHNVVVLDELRAHDNFDALESNIMGERSMGMMGMKSMKDMNKSQKRGIISIPTILPSCRHCIIPPEKDTPSVFVPTNPTRPLQPKTTPQPLTSTDQPIFTPTIKLTIAPTVLLNQSESPSLSPSISRNPTITKKPSISISPNITRSPSRQPTVKPSKKPSENPSIRPTIRITEKPVMMITLSPTNATTTTLRPTVAPITLNPTSAPTPIVLVVSLLPFQANTSESIDSSYLQDGFENYLERNLLQQMLPFLPTLGNGSSQEINYNSSLSVNTVTITNMTQTGSNDTWFAFNGTVEIQFENISSSAATAKIEEVTNAVTKSQSVLLEDGSNSTDMQLFMNEFLLYNTTIDNKTLPINITVLVLEEGTIPIPPIIEDERNDTNIGFLPDSELTSNLQTFGIIFGSIFTIICVFATSAIASRIRIRVVRTEDVGRDLDSANS